MNKQSPSVARVTVGILWVPLCMASNAMAVVDVLHAMALLAQERQGGASPACWQWLAPGDAPAGVPVPSPVSCASDAAMDVLVIPGWLVSTGPRLRAISRAHARWLVPLLHAHVARGGLVVAFFNGAALLAEAGLLRAREAALPWAFAPSIIHQAGDAVQWRRDVAWHRDGPIWTTADLPSALPAMLDLLQHTAAADLARATATVLLHDATRQLATPARLETPTGRPTSAGGLEQARRWLQVHRAEPYRLAAVARAAATRERTVLRWFAQVHGQTPLEYLHGLRVAQAQSLLQSSYLSVEAVALQCGYVDAGSLRKVFARVVGMTPGAYRQRFGLRTSRKQWAGPEH